MPLSHQTRKQLQSLISDPRWAAVENAFNEYMRENFTVASVKRSNEFDTVWYLAESEGGKHHLNRFINTLENEAAKASSNEE